MPAPKDVSTLQSFLGSVQFYAKFLPFHFSTNAVPLYKLQRNDVSWKWGSVEAKAFNNLKKFSPPIPYWFTSIVRFLWG